MLIINIRQEILINEFYKYLDELSKKTRSRKRHLLTSLDRRLSFPFQDIRRNFEANFRHSQKPTTRKVYQDAKEKCFIPYFFKN